MVIREKTVKLTFQPNDVAELVGKANNMEVFNLKREVYPFETTNDTFPILANQIVTVEIKVTINEL